MSTWKSVSPTGRDEKIPCRKKVSRRESHQILEVLILMSNLGSKEKYYQWVISLVEQQMAAKGANIGIQIFYNN